MGDVAFEMGLDDGLDFHRQDKEGHQLQAMAQNRHHWMNGESRRSHEWHSCLPL